MKPGSTRPTCTPCARSSAHSASDQPASANFEALYAPAPARATRPAVEETFTIALGADCAQQRQQRLGQPHLRVEVDLHRAPHVGVAAVGEARAPGCAGVVDEQVEPSVAFEHVLADALGRVVVEQIDGEHADAILAQLGGERAQALLAAGDEHERAAGLAREPARGRLADAAAGAGDQRRRVDGLCSWTC